MRARSRWFVATIVLGTSTGCQSAHELPPIDGSLDVLVDSPAESPPEARPEHRLAMTWSHACFLDDVSRLFCWGSNLHGELGVGIAPTLDEGAVYEPMWVSDDFVVVSVGVWSTAAIDETGALWGWGRNASGWLEDGTQDDATRPIRIGTDNDWIDVAVGSGVVCAIHAGGGAECWGRGDYGESTPAPIEPGEPRHVHPEGTFAWTVGGGWYHQYLRRTDRTWLHVVHDRGTISFEPSPADATPILTPAVRGTYFLDHEGHAWFDELRGTSRSFALHDGAEVLAASYASLSLVGARLRYVTEPGTSSVDTMLPGRATELRAGVRRGCARLANDEVWCVGVATADPLAIDAARVVFPE